jgi:FkbM family methyltransferase
MNETKSATVFPRVQGLQLRTRTRFLGLLKRTVRHFTRQKCLKQARPNPVYMGNNILQSRTHWGDRIFLSTLNLDVCPSIIETGWWEPWNDHLLRRLLKPGHTYVNIGANFGYFTLLGGNLVTHTGRVYSVEANPNLFIHLMQSVHRCGYYGRTKLFNICMYDRVGETLQMRFCTEFSGGGGLEPHMPKRRNCIEASLDDDFLALAEKTSLLRDFRPGVDDKGRMHIGGPGEGSIYFQMPTTTLDAMVGDDTVDVLMMDIEGAEVYAVLGGQNVIRRSQKLAMIMEWSYSARAYASGPGDPGYRAVEFLAAEGFRFYRIVPPIGNSFDNMPQLCEVKKNDLYALPHCDILVARQPLSDFEF